MNIFKRLKFVFSYGPEIDEILRAESIKRDDALRESRKDYLNLCARHQQRSPGAVYSEHNCEFCVLKKELQKQAYENVPRIKYQYDEVDGALAELPEQNFQPPKMDFFK